MILDFHVHIFPGPVEPDRLRTQMRDAGVDGALLISNAPKCFGVWTDDTSTQDRLDNVFEWVAGNPSMYPFFWIDPTEEDALKQVDMAVEAGVMGFKVICGHFYPNDERAMPVFRAIAAAGKPILFHSGILWDGHDSSRYNRPAEFEVLLDIAGLKFAMAHISWPWCDELIAVYGKFLSAHKQRQGEVSELFIDMTPGTPRIYREDALRKIFTVGYNVRENVLFGSDQVTRNYKSDVVSGLISRDKETMRALGVEDDVIDAVFGGNLKRFVGV